MEVIEHTILNSCSDIFSIYPLGDIHGGSIDCAEDEIKKKVEEVRTNRNAYWIGMGDMVESITKNDKRFEICGLAEWVKPDNIIESQRRWLKDLLKPIAPKCLGFLMGNHEWTILQNNSDDITRNLCYDLKVPYGGYACFITMTFKRKNSNETHRFVIHAWHGSGAAQSEGGQLMRLTKLVNDVKADIYLMGHLHTIDIYTPDRLECRNGRVVSTRLIAAITGSWLRTYTQPKGIQHLNASYGERKGYKPSRIGCPIIKLSPYKGWFTVEV